MNIVGKILFWILTAASGFVNPLISVGLIILYYLPRIIQDLCKSCNEPSTSKMNSLSDEIMEEMK